MLKQLSPSSTDFTVTIFKIFQMSKHLSVMPFGTHTTHQTVKRCKGLSGHAKAILQLYKVLKKLGVLSDRFFKDRNIGKYGKFVRNTKINQRKSTSCLIGTADNKFEIVISTPRSREIFINCLISCGIGSFKR